MLKSSNANADGIVFTGEPGYVPPTSSVVAPSVLAEVFEDGVMPFATNTDGSVDWSVYQGWLRETWAGGMAQFDDQSEMMSPLLLQEKPAA
jgi:hypothetical protein